MPSPASRTRAIAWARSATASAGLVSDLERERARIDVIFLDLPGWACLWGIFQRRLRHGGGQHPATGVYDRITWGFIRYIVGYRRKRAPRVRALIADHARNAQVTVLGSRAAVRRYVVLVSDRGLRIR